MEGVALGTSLPPLPADPQMFSIDRFYYLFERNLKGAETDQMEVNFYADLYFESLKLFKYFGKCITMGFKDIQDKANMLLVNQKVLKIAY
jgi:hypothetical protein